jgi:hypothetical protein
LELRLLNGMNPLVPEVTVLIDKVTRNQRAGEYELHIKKILGFKHWDKRRPATQKVKGGARRRTARYVQQARQIRLPRYICFWDTDNR